MKCTECGELLVARSEGLLDSGQEAALGEHLRSCPACRAEAEGLRRLRERLTRDGRLLSAAGPNPGVMDVIVRTRPSDIEESNMTRRRRTRWSLAVASAAAALVLAVALFGLGRTAPAAYAVEQTVAAYRGVRFVHLKVDPAGQGLREAWAEFGGDGSLVHLRMDFPATVDGPKDVLWEKDKARVWFHAKKTFLVVREPDMLASISRSFPDPKLAVEQLYEDDAAGKVHVDAQPPEGADGVIRLTVTYPDSPDRREVWLVDARTKLLKELQKQKRVGDKYLTRSRIELLDNDHPIAASVFAFDLPKDVMLIDQTTQEIGLARGDMSEDEVAVELVRQFFEALIAEDYAKAGRLLEGIPADRMKETFGRVRWLRIVSLGKPFPQPIPGVGGLCVPYEVEIEADGVRSIKKFNAAVRPVYNQPDRWTIHGGI
jgi:hypothetical protein